MTQQQYERWKDFALRMARTCYATARRPSGRWIVEVVTEFFDQLDEDDIPCIVNWDHSTAYPEGNPCRGREFHLSYCGCDGYRGKHDQDPNPECEECHGSGVHHGLESPYGVGDMMSEFLYDYEPGEPECKSCLGESDDECRCDEICMLFSEQWDEQFGGPPRCCIRAGLDCASEPSAGVVGFTAGDVRRMYPEGVPDWVFPPGERLHYWLSDEVNGTFEELPDSTGVVL